MRRFLIVKTSSLGDIIHCFPVVSYLKDKFPHCRIDWMVEKPFAELILAHPDIDRAIQVQTKKWRRSPFSTKTWREFQEFRQYLKKVEYDLIIDLQGNLKSGFLGFQSQGKIRLGFGRQTVPECLNLLFTNKKISPPPGKNIRDDYLNLVKGYFSDQSEFKSQNITLKSDLDFSRHLSNTAKNVMVCPGAHWKNKQLPIETWRTLLKELPHIHFLFVWGNKAEKQMVEMLKKDIPNSVVMPHLSLPDLQNLMSQVDLVIAMDSLPLHLAGTTNTATFGLFGPSSAEKYRPLGPKHLSLQGPCPYREAFNRRCPKLRTCSTGACTRSLEANEILKILKTRALVKNLS